MRGEQQQVGDGWFSFSEEGGEHGEAAGRLDWLKESRQGHHTSEQPWAANLQRLHNRGSGGKGGGGGGGGRARALRDAPQSGSPRGRQGRLARRLALARQERCFCLINHLLPLGPAEGGGRESAGSG